MSIEADAFVQRGEGTTALIERSQSKGQRVSMATAFVCDLHLHGEKLRLRCELNLAVLHLPPLTRKVRVESLSKVISDSGLHTGSMRGCRSPRIYLWQFFKESFSDIR